MKICDILRTGKPTVSFEFFPPKRIRLLTCSAIKPCSR